MTYNDYMVLEYIILSWRKSVDAKDLTEEEMRGWLDNYHKADMNQSEIDTSISSLIDRGLVVKSENTYRASEESKALWKASRHLMGDLFGLSDSTRSCFKKNLQRVYGIER